MTYPSVHETLYHGSKPGLIAFVVPHGADSQEFLAAYPEIAADPQMQAVWPLFETYLAIERDLGAEELAHATAHRLSRRFDVTALVAMVSYPRGIIDGGRVLGACLRPCLPRLLSDRLRRSFLAVHAETLLYLEDLYHRLAQEEFSYLLDIHTMASYCPVGILGQRDTIPVSFPRLEDYVEQYLSAHHHAYQRSIDLITADDHGHEWADPALVRACSEALAAYPLARNEPYQAAEAYLSRQHLRRSRAISIDVPKHLLATCADDLSLYELDAVTLAPERIADMAEALARAVASLRDQAKI